MSLADVINHNRVVQARARELNTRAGARVFPTLIREEIEIWLRERLAGARCASEVQDLDAIKLPDLDETLVSIVQAGNPDHLMVAGMTFQVTYTETNPLIKLPWSLMDTKVWKDLPDAGVILPGGRAVEVLIEFSYYDTFRETNIPKLKAACTARLNKRIWDDWNYGAKPTIQLPDLATDPEASIPDLIEVSYGTSLVDGTPLIAFGVVCMKEYRYFGANAWFEGRWFQSRAEAETERTKSVFKLKEVRAEVIAQAARESSREAIHRATTNLNDLPRHKYWHRLNANLQTEVRARIGFPVGFTSAANECWLIETQALLARVNAVLTKIAGANGSSPAPTAPEPAKPTPSPAAVASSKPVDVKTLDLSGLFGGNAKHRPR